jgi:diguanylate cyclase (GGDEF)-like protein
MDRPVTPRDGAGRSGDPGEGARDVRRADREGATAARGRRSASRSLWDACEALLSAGSDPDALDRALQSLCLAFDCAGVALHALAPSGELEPWCSTDGWEVRPGDLRASVSVPLLHLRARVGTLDLLARPGQRFHADQLGLVRTASGALGAAIGARLELERLRDQPGRDPVTGLPDARAFQQRLVEEVSRARRHGVPVAVVHLDLDHFAALNDRYGRDIGDVLLAEAALVLKLALRESDTLARLGGDAFGAVLPETDQVQAVRAADRIRRVLEDHRFARVGHVTASAGVAASPLDGVDPLELLERADRALSVAKKSGRRKVSASPRSNTH